MPTAIYCDGSWCTSVVVAAAAAAAAVHCRLPLAPLWGRYCGKVEGQSRKVFHPPGTDPEIFDPAEWRKRLVCAGPELDAPVVRIMGAAQAQAAETESLRREVGGLKAEVLRMQLLCKEAGSLKAEVLRLRLLCGDVPAPSE